MNANAEINADNTEQPQNALSKALSEINASIFEIGETIPNGVYLSMMDNSKKIFDEINKIKQPPIRLNFTIDEKTNYILNKEDKILRLRRITKENDGEGEYLRLWEEEQQFMSVKTLRINQIIRIFETKNKYKFVRITKINEMSFKYDILEFEGNEKRIRKNNTLKFKDKTYYENFENRNILFYNEGHATTTSLFSKISIIFNENLEIVNDNLKITIT